MSDAEEIATTPAPVSIRKRLLVGSGIFALLLVALGFGENLFQRSRSASALKQALADLDKSDPGWRLEDLVAARAEIPDDRNSAVTVMNAYRLQRTWGKNHEKLPKLNELARPELLDAEGLAVLERELKANEAAVVVARKLSEMPLGRHRLVLDPNPYLTRLQDQQNTRSICDLLQYDALCLAQKGNLAEALRSCRAIFNAARSLDDEPILITQLIRFAGANIAASAVERTLALGEAAENDLAAVAQMAEEEEAHPGYRVGLRGERAIQHLLFTGVADGTLSLKDLIDNKSSTLILREKYAGWTLRALARREHPLMLALMNRAVEISYLPYHEQPAAEDDLRDEIHKFKGTESLIALVTPAVQSIAAAQRRKAAQLRCLVVLLAVERHRLKKGAWPANLEELTPKWIKAVPLDPFDGKPLRYKLMADGVIVYSVGPDGIDNGGDIEPHMPSGQALDMGCRLWDVKQRRRPPRPKPPPAPPLKIPGPAGEKR